MDVLRLSGSAQAQSQPHQRATPVLAAATCLLVGVVVVNARPGGHAESYLVSNLDTHGGFGLGGGLGGGSGGLGGGSGLGGYGGSLGGGSSGLGGDKYEKYEVYADHHPKYAFKYGVEDKHTGDYKDAQEERDGDVVKGEYSLLQPDGRKRIVHYTASKHGGFNAYVSYSGHAIHPEQHIQQKHYL